MTHTLSIRKQTRLWETRDQGKIRICDMTNNHLCNTIRMLRRYAVQVCDNLTAEILFMPQPQGDMASYYYDQELDRALHHSADDYLPEIYDNLMADAERRGINI